MEDFVKEAVWGQFGAAMLMLKKAIAACPETVWNGADQFWYRAYHTLFFLDLYLDKDPQQFHPPEPFTLSEFEDDGTLPPEVYTPAQLLSYLDFCYAKCYQAIQQLTATQRWTTQRRDHRMLDLMIYNLRHVQHHTGQLNLILRQAGFDAPDWISYADEKLP